MSTPAPTAGAAASAPPLAPCWRCGKDVLRNATSCPQCGAPRRRLADRGPAAEAPRSPVTAVTRVLAFFAVTLVVLLLHGATASPLPEKGLTRGVARAHLWSIVAFEILDAIVVGVALWVIGRPARSRRITDAPPASTWAVAAAGGGLVLGVNFAYHAVLRGYLGVREAADPLIAATGVGPLVLFAYCLEPAVIEELFFRYLALDTLRGVMNVHAAVLVSSLMFGVAHIGVPLSIPVLTLVGVVLGYARVSSGRLALPMLLHFLHNLVVVLL